VGKVLVGGDAQVSVQSMTTTPTTDINATLQQIAELTASGCDIVRVAVPTREDAEVLHIIAKKSQIPVIADIHFQPNYVYTAIDAGCAAVRVNPGNIRKFDDQVGEIAARAQAAGVSIRIGVNAGSLDPRLLEKYGKATPEALVESAVWEAGLFEEHDFHDFKISVKHNDPVIMVKAYRMLAERGDWPLHLGVTEAGPAFQGTIKSATAFGILLGEGIGVRGGNCTTTAGLFEKHGGWLVALSRSLPVLPEAIACLAGLVRMPWRPFLISLVCGTLPLGFAFAAIGALGVSSPTMALVLSAVVPVGLWLLARRMLKV
jgi:1-hydroxy-2-methyl-2-(E)-butenyl 4-diphosphate synthase